MKIHYHPVWLGFSIQRYEEINVMTDSYQPIKKGWDIYFMFWLIII
jgi:hypothetical protein